MIAMLFSVGLNVWLATIITEMIYQHFKWGILVIMRINSFVLILCQNYPRL